MGRGRYVFFGKVDAENVGVFFVKVGGFFLKAGGFILERSVGFFWKGRWGDC